jgi:hypothetical protein
MIPHISQAVKPFTQGLNPSIYCTGPGEYDTWCIMTSRTEHPNHDIAAPIMLVGAERSGTTLLRLLLDHHPKIAFQREFEFAVDLLGPDGQRPGDREFQQWLRENFVFQGSGFTIDESLEYRDLLNDFLHQKQGDKALIGATIHRHYQRIPFLWPKARFIHLLRDGRDVARSCIGMGWAGNVYAGADEWIEAIDLWEKTKATIPEEDRIEMRYEDLVENTEDELKRLCKWIGVEYNSAMFDYTKTTKYRAPNAKLAHQWKRKLDDNDLQLIEARIGHYLDQYGYERSGLPPIEITPAIDARLRREDRHARYRWRMGRYGAMITLAETLTRRLGLAPLNTALKQRMYNIDHDRFASP